MLFRRQLRKDENEFPFQHPWLESLPALPDSRGPADANWNNSVALCGVMKDENITDVREWLHYYKYAASTRCAPAACISL